MKQRMSTVDVRVIATELGQTLPGSRLQNIYDISPRQIQLRFSRSAASRCRPASSKEEGEKEEEDYLDEEGEGNQATGQLKEEIVIESGLRLHPTRFQREMGKDIQSMMPGAFVMKLRKHLRSRRLRQVRQLGYDRVVDFEFSAPPLVPSSTEERSYHLICEFFAAGNIILTDHDFKIMALLRIVHGTSEAKVNETYRYEDHLRPFAPLTEHRLHQLLFPVADALAPDAKKQAAKGAGQIRRRVGMQCDLGMAMIESALTKIGYAPREQTMAESDVPRFMAEIEQLNAMVDTLAHTPPKEAYLILPETVDANQKTVVYEDYLPFYPAHYPTSRHHLMPSFGEAVDLFYANLANVKKQTQHHSASTQSQRKLDALKREQSERIRSLHQATKVNTRKARLIEEHLVLVDGICDFFRQCQEHGIDWKEVVDVVQSQREAQEGIAKCIVGMNLQKGLVQIELESFEHSYFDDSEDEEGVTLDKEEEDDEEEDDGRAQRQGYAERVEIDVALSAYANARRYYDMKREAAAKEDRTAEAAKKVIKQQEKQVVRSQIASQQALPPSVPVAVRQPAWFEKFQWFLSSEGYLVLAGRDPQQTELLCRRYMQEGDAFVSADVPNAPNLVVKNRLSSEHPIPAMTLAQAGSAALCLSAAWENKVVTSAFWAEPKKVSKFNGQSKKELAVGHFVILGKKHYLPPSGMVYGFGILWKISESSLLRHPDRHRLPLDAEQPPTMEHEEGEAEQPNGEEEEESSSEEEEKEEVKEAREDKYELASSSSSSEEEEQPEPKADDLMKKRYVSAKERKQLKKGSLTGESEPAEPSTNGKSDDAPAPPKNVRGKKGKLKKMKTKYADQSDEERQLRINLLGSSGQPLKEEAKKAEKAPPPKQQQKKTVAANSNPFMTEEESDAMRTMVMSEKALDIKLADTNQYTSLLVGNPFPEDELLHAIPMAAPYHVLSNFKYKVKLLPGAIKRGKGIPLSVHHVHAHWFDTQMIAAKQVMHAFAVAEEGTLREKELLRAVPDSEAMMHMLSKVRLSGLPPSALQGKKGGGPKTKTQSKPKKKKK